MFLLTLEYLLYFVCKILFWWGTIYLNYNRLITRLLWHNFVMDNFHWVCDTFYRWYWQNRSNVCNQEYTFVLEKITGYKVKIDGIIGRKKHLKRKAKVNRKIIKCTGILIKHTKRKKVSQ